MSGLEIQPERISYKCGDHSATADLHCDHWSISITFPDSYPSRRSFMCSRDQDPAVIVQAVVDQLAPLQEAIDAARAPMDAAYAAYEAAMVAIETDLGIKLHTGPGLR